MPLPSENKFTIMSRIIIVLLFMLCCTVHATGQRTSPARDWKDLISVMDRLSKDTTLSDSLRGTMGSADKLIRRLKTVSDSLALVRPVTVRSADTPHRPATPIAATTKTTDSGTKVVTPVAGTTVPTMPIADTLSTVALTKEVRTISRLTVFVAYITLLLVALAIVGTWQFSRITRRIRREPRRMKGQTSIPTAETTIPPAETAMLPTKTAIPPTQTTILPTQTTVVPTEAAPIPVPVAIGEATRGFRCEMLMTAGPRKDELDIELGEDTCGFVTQGDQAALWLLDGTSLDACLRDPATGREYFSSRLLAQSIGNGLRKVLLEKTTADQPLEQLIEETIAKVRNHWIGCLNELSPEARTILKRNIGNKYFPVCSTTLLAVRLSLEGDLLAYRTGDSKMLLFQSPGGLAVLPEKKAGELLPSDQDFSTKRPESNDRIFFRIVAGQQEELDIDCHSPSYEVMRHENINSMIVYSDGVGPHTEHTLKNGYAQNPAEAREAIIDQHQGTLDDKSICFLSIV